jgi:hypothetical protein
MMDSNYSLIMREFLWEWLSWVIHNTDTRPEFIGYLHYWSMSSVEDLDQMATDVSKAEIYSAAKRCWCQ